MENFAVDRGFSGGQADATKGSLVGASAMAGAIGAGGLGDLAVPYGYQRFEASVMVAVVVLIVVVCGSQLIGDRVVAWLDRRK